MTNTQKRKRNTKLYAKFVNHEATKTELAEEFNLSWVQVDRIIKKEREAHRANN